jgi:hypothetical protein
VALGQQLTAAGIDLRGAGPVISDFPIWLADTQEVAAIALPAEPPSSVVDLARTFDSQWLVTSGGDDAMWPAVLDAGGSDASCFTPVALPVPANRDLARALEGTHLYRVGCR